MADGMLSLAWNNHSSTFCHMLSTVRDAELYTDVTIACDGKFYPAHKLVLSTCSDYFQKMFERTPCKHPVIVIKDVKGSSMEALLNYMYAGVVNVSQSDLAQLIRAAELLEIKGLAVPDEPPSDSKRPVQIRDTSVDSSSPNPKRPRQDEKRASNQEEAPHVDSSVPSCQSSSLRRDDSLEEQMNTYDVCKKVNQRQTQNEHRQDRKDTSSSRRSQQVGSEQGLGYLVPEGGSQDEAARDGGIKEERIKLEAESEAADMGYEYDSLMTDLMGDEGGETKEHSASVEESFNQSLNEESYSAEAGPSGLQVWPDLGEGGESANQGYTGGLPLTSHPGQQPHQMQHMVGDACVGEGRENSGGVEPHTTKHPAYKCPVCANIFLRPSHLKRHIRTHTGEKPFTCPFCSFRTARNCNLKTHLFTHRK